MISIQETNHDLAVDFKKEFSRKLIRFGTVIAAVIIGIVFFVFFIKYQVSDIRSSRADRQWFIKSLNAIVELNNSQARADEIISKFENMLPTAVEVPTKVIPLLKNEAQINGLKIDVKLGSFRQPENEEPAGVDFSLRADGNLQNIINFWAGFEKDKLVQAYQWDLLPAGTADYQLSFSGKIYTREGN